MEPPDRRSSSASGPIDRILVRPGTVPISHPSRQKIRTTGAKWQEARDNDICWLEQILSDGRKFIFGEHPSAADLAAYHPIWFARENGGAEIEAVLPPLATSPWYDRVSALGHGNGSALTPEAAIEIAGNASPEGLNLWSEEAANLDLRPGDRVRVSSDDYGKDPVVGHLLAWTAEEVVIQREEPTVGAVNLHFPRVGYDIRPDRLAT
ncbi:MAG: glutathione S-transferase C-terminal domain-containing protein [Alphaproteobacteria bacterium]|nr:glutathione S-transferase C-terminal domain-containing protein [Alphaproteobacteria bacterium]